jgi:streptomycin 6-kinase
VTDRARKRLIARFGPGVEAWWERLPDLLARLAELWRLDVGEPVGRGNTSFVIRCRRADGRAAVLKVTPEPALAAAEADALRRWAPTGRVPALWEADAAAGALLLEAIPGEPAGRPGLAGVAALLRDLHAADPAGAPPLAERVEFVFAHWLDRQVGRLAPDALMRGRETARALAADPVPCVLLHGDLHPGNVLAGGPERGLVAIDPRPCAGDPAFDAVDWVFQGEPDPSRWRPRAGELAAAAGCDGERLWRWCRAFGPMLAAARLLRGARPEDVAALLALSAT